MGQLQGALLTFTPNLHERYLLCISPNLHERYLLCISAYQFQNHKYDIDQESTESPARIPQCPVMFPLFWCESSCRVFHLVRRQLWLYRCVSAWRRPSHRRLEGLHYSNEPKQHFETNRVLIP